MAISCLIVVVTLNNFDIKWEATWGSGGELECSSRLPEESEEKGVNSREEWFISLSLLCFNRVKLSN